MALDNLIRMSPGHFIGHKHMNSIKTSEHTRVDNIWKKQSKFTEIKDGIQFRIIYSYTEVSRCGASWL